MAIGTTLKISFDGTEVQSGIRMMTVGFSTFAKTGLGVISGVTSKFTALVKGGIMAAVASVTALSAAMVAFGVSSASAAMEMEDLETQFGVLLNSSEDAKKMLGEFRKEAMKSPLGILDYAKAGKTLLSFGVAQEKIMPTLKAIGDVSMGNAERFDRLSLAFAQTASAGRLMGGEVRQFIESGFNPLQEISKRTGRSMVDLKKDMEDGAISSAMVSDAFRTATSEGGLFFGALERGSQTTSGQLAKMKDSFDQLRVAFGTGLNDGLRRLYSKLSELAPKFTQTFTEAGQRIGDALGAAIGGDMTGLKLIGRDIGEAIKTGLRMAFETAGFENLYDKLAVIVPRIQNGFRKIGGILGSALMDGVEGDTAKLEAIGFYIGTLLKDGILSGLKATGEEIAVGLTKIAEDYGITGISGSLAKAAGVSGTMESGKKGYSGFMQENASKRQDMLRQIEMSSPETREINGQVFRKAFEGEKAQDGKFAYDENGQKLILIMEKVEKNTREGAKM